MSDLIKLAALHYPILRCWWSNLYSIFLYAKPKLHSCKEALVTEFRNEELIWEDKKKAAAYTAMKPTATAGKRRARMDCSEDIAEGSGAIFLARTG